MMIKPWLIRIVGKTKTYISLHVLASFVGLLANIAVVFSISGLLQSLADGTYTAAAGGRTLLIAGAGDPSSDQLRCLFFLYVLPGLG